MLKLLILQAIFANLCYLSYQNPTADNGIINCLSKCNTLPDISARNLALCSARCVAFPDTKVENFVYSKELNLINGRMSAMFCTNWFGSSSVVERVPNLCPYENQINSFVSKLDLSVRNTITGSFQTFQQSLRRNAEIGMQSVYMLNRDSFQLFKSLAGAQYVEFLNLFGLIEDSNGQPILKPQEQIQQINMCEFTDKLKALYGKLNEQAKPLVDQFICGLVETFKSQIPNIFNSLVANDKEMLRLISENSNEIQQMSNLLLEFYNSNMNF